MNTAYGKQGAREYVWFAIVLVILLLGSAARAPSAADAVSPQVAELAASR
jgi:hypothetical protein